MHLFLLSLVLVSSTQSPTEVPKSIRGTWVPVKWELAGSTTPPKTMPKMTLTIWRDHYEFVEGPSVDAGQLKIIAETKPAAIDITGVKGPNSGRKIPAIYKLSEDKLTICYGLDGHRPKEFQSPKKSLVLLVTFSRKTGEPGK